MYNSKSEYTHGGFIGLCLRVPGENDSRGGKTGGNMAVVTMKQLLEAGVHFGHQTRRWNPKMAEYIFTERNGIHIIDLQQTVKKIEEAYAFIRDTVINGGEILFVGTKKQAQDSIEEEAVRCGMYFAKSRWLGGMLTSAGVSAIDGQRKR